MGDKNMLFAKPVGVLGRALENDVFGPDAVIIAKVVQNGFKIRVMGEQFVAKNVDEAKELFGKKLDKLVADLKKNDKK